jgi:hypothetical protein
MNLQFQRTRPLRALLTAFALSCAGVTAALSGAAPAHADTQICDQYGSAKAGSYIVQNNAYNEPGTQCINATSDGFSITESDGSVAFNGAPKSYPSIYNGCHYGNCSPGTVLPKQISTISSAPSSISYTYVSNATYDASYDIWLDPTAKTTGVNQTEIMIWLNHAGSIQPVGSQTSTASIDGTNWAVWTGNNGSNNVISFVAPSAMTSASIDVKDFINNAIAHNLATTAWYLTSIQAGIEPWAGGAGLAVNSFSATINNGSGTTGGSTTGGSTTGGSTTGGTTTGGSTTGGSTTGGTTTGGSTTGGSTTGGTGGASCKVTYTPQSWPGGFTANVTINNTGSSAINGWKLGFTLPSGQTVTSAWNATVSPSSGAVTASSQSYNAAIPAGGNTSFGFQGTYTGSYASPSSFSLNGTACS